MAGCMMCTTAAAVHDDPFAVFSPSWRGTGNRLLDGFAHAGGQGLGLAVGGTRGHDHALEQRRQVLGVEHLDVVGLDVFEAVNNGSLEFGDVRLAAESDWVEVVIRRWNAFRSI
jgi:hypothetical protein